MIHDVIYIPGLGDHRAKGQELLIKSWRLWGVRPHIIRTVWNDGQEFLPKLEKVLDVIDQLHAAGHRVYLVGASAGATMAINAYAARQDKVGGVVLIAGWVNYPGNIGPGYRRKNPAFVESAYRVQTSLESLQSNEKVGHIQSRCAIVDPIVPRKYSLIPGAHMKTVLSLGHAPTIATQLLFGAPFWVHFLKRRAK